MDEFEHAQLLNTATTSFGENYILEISRDIFKSADSTTIFHKKFGKNFLNENSFHVICGTDSGLLIKHLLHSPIPESAKVIFVELPEVLSWLDNAGIIRDLPANIALISPQDFAAKILEMGINSYIIRDTLFFIPSLSVQYGYYPPYEELAKQTHDHIKTLHWNIRVELDRKDFIIGQLENVCENLYHWHSLHKRCKGRTAVLLAGGPSLDDILPWVVSNRKKLIVFAVSRVAKRLLNAGIKPDFFVTVHTQDISFDVSKEMLLFSQDSTLIYHSQACPKLISQWRGKRFYMGHLFPWTSTLNIAGKDLVGPTVSHAAYDVMVKLGCKTIILGGVDLCFSPQSRSHASHSLESERTSQAEGGDLQVQTNEGKQAETTFAFHRGIIELGKMAVKAKQSGCSTINFSPNSARIKSVQYTELTQIHLPGGKKHRKIAQPKQNFVASRQTAHLGRIKSEMLKAQGTAKIIRQKCLIAFQSVVKAENSSADDISDTVKDCDRLLSLFKNAEYSWMFETVYSFGIYFFTSLIPPVDCGNENRLEVLNYYKLLFTAVIVSTDRLTHYLDEALARCNARLEEISAIPDLNIIIDQWKRDNQPGRAHIFHDIITATSAVIEKKNSTSLDELIVEFNNVLTGEQTENISTTTLYDWNSARLTKLRNRILDLFQHKKQSDLHQLIGSLESDGSAKIKEYLLLAKGLLCELNTQHVDALGYYNSVVNMGDDGDNEVLTDSLSRIASVSISLNDRQNAQLALQCLADISVSHMPSYAEFLYITKQREAALDVYADYLEKVPDDLSTMLKLGQIYKEMNSPEGVKMITDYVLEREPQNQTALKLKEYLN